ncbi:MAG: hypothetical protein ACREH8_23615 [Opitutaceae bacterium]
MLKLLRFFCCARFVIICLADLRAENSPASPPGSSTAAATALPPELQAELDALARSAWLPSTTARGSLGWRDNVLLSPFAPIERVFARGELEAILMRPMRNRWEFISFLNGEVLRYFSPPEETHGEQQWSLHTEGRWQPFDRARLALKGAGYMRDMVIDLSETEASRVVAPTRVRGGYVVAATRVTWRGFHVEPSVQLKRTDYRDYAGDYDEVRTGGRVEWRHRERFGISAAWFEGRRRYDQRTQFNAGGRALPGTHLRFRQRDGELKLRSAWERGGEWFVAGTLGRMENRDHTSGYFDYNQRRARLELGWNRAGWRLNLDADGRRMDYVVQTVGAGIAPPPRISDDYEVMLRAERELDDRWTVFGEHRWERSRSNELEFNYRANTVLAGVQRNF